MPSRGAAAASDFDWMIEHLGHVLICSCMDASVAEGRNSVNTEALLVTSHSDEWVAHEPV